MSFGLGGYVYKWLRDDTERNMAVDGSVTPVEYKYTNPGPGSLQLERMIVYIEDGGSFDSGRYGNSGDPLTVGIGVAIKDAQDAIRLDLLDGEPITTNGEWAAMCYDVTHENYGSGNEYIAVRWTFGKAGQALTLREGESFVMTVNDDLEFLVKHYAQIQGNTG